MPKVRLLTGAKIVGKAQKSGSQGMQRLDVRAQTLFTGATLHTSPFVYSLPLTFYHKSPQLCKHWLLAFLRILVVITLIS